MSDGLTPEILNSINDALIEEAADNYMEANVSGDVLGAIKYGNELVFLAIKRQERPKQWIEIGQRALLQVCGDNQSLLGIARCTPFFSTDEYTLQLVAGLSGPTVGIPGFVGREEALIQLARRQKSTKNQPRFTH